MLDKVLEIWTDIILIVSRRLMYRRGFYQNFIKNLGTRIRNSTKILSLFMNE